MGEHIENTYCLILAGGNGKRLWPYSTRPAPKQFLDFFGVGKSLLRLTYERFAAFIPRENIIVSTYEGYAYLVRRELPELPDGNLLTEPVQLNTAPVAARVTLNVMKRNPDAKLIVSPADQYVLDTDKFRHQIAKGLDFVQAEHKVVVIGAKPTSPNTNYGYIQADRVVGDEDFHYIQTFTEKPDKEFAKVFVESGEFLWNTGMFLWDVRTMTTHLHHLVPMMEEYKESLGQRFSRMTAEEEEEAVRKNYPRNISLSIDIALLENVSDIVVQQTDFGWTDLGSWTDVADVNRSDVDGNTLLCGAQAMMRGCKNNIVKLPEGKLALLQGLEDYLVADHDNVLVVCRKDDRETLRNLMNSAHVKYGEDYM